MRRNVRNDRRLRQTDNSLIPRKDKRIKYLGIPIDLHDKVLLSSGRHGMSFNSEVLRLIQIALNIECKEETA